MIGDCDRRHVVVSGHRGQAVVVTRPIEEAESRVQVKMYKSRH